MRKVLVIVGIFIVICTTICFIPFNANKLIPIVQKQILNQYGLDINIHKLTLKVTPSITIKSPECKLNYNNTPFANVSGVKIKIAFIPLLKKEVKITYLRIDGADIDIKLDEQNKPIILNYLKNNKEIMDFTKIRLKHYNINLIDKNLEQYLFSGSEFIFTNHHKNKSLKIATNGKLFIDSIKHIDYDICFGLNGILTPSLNNYNFIDLLEQIKEKQANASIVADLKIKNSNGKYSTDGSLSLDKVTCIVNNKKLPYSHASFNMLGNKTSISSVIYTNPNDKININGYVMNSDNPSFNLTVKSDEINLKDIVYFARLFSDVSNLNQINDINGTLFADFIIKGSLKKIRSNGIFRIDDASIFTKNFNIVSLNSYIDFKDNKIDIRNTKGFINNAPFSICGDIISNNFNINFIVNKYKFSNLSIQKFKLKSGIISIIGNISGPYNCIIPKIEAEINNGSGSHNALKYKFNNLSFKSINKNSGELTIKNITCNMPHIAAISIPFLKTNLIDTNINISPFDIITKDTKINISGKVQNYNNEKATLDLTGNGFINPQGLLNVKELNTTLPVFIELSGDKYIQYINIQALQQSSNAIISFAQPVILNLLAKYSDGEFKIIDGSINSYNGIFTPNLKKNIANSNKIAIATGSIENINHLIFKNIKLNIIKICPINVSHYTAKINGNLIINGDIKKPEIIGSLKCPIISDKYGCLTIKNLIITLTKNIISFNSNNTKIFDSILSFTGTAEANIQSGIKIKTINVKSKDLDLDNLSLILLMSQNMGLNISIDNGTLFSENFNIKTPFDYIKLTELNSSYNLINNILSINSINANMYNGAIAGNIKLNIIDSKYTGTIQGRGISSGLILKNMTNLKENISGKLDFDMDLNSSIKSKFLKNANIKFIIRDGQMSTLGKVEHFLYAQNIIADNMIKTSLAVVGRAISAKDTGLFKYMNGIIVINEDMVKVNYIKMLGPNMSMYITGNYGLMSNTANLNIIGRLSNTIVSSLGSFGTFTMDKFRIALTGNSTEDTKFMQQGLENLPQLSQRNTKEFKSVIYGPLEAKSSVRSFTWLSESEKEYHTQEVHQTNVSIPKFIENLPY